MFLLLLSVEFWLLKHLVKVGLGNVKKQWIAGGTWGWGRRSLKAAGWVSSSRALPEGCCEIPTWRMRSARGFPMAGRYWVPHGKGNLAPQVPCLIAPRAWHTMVQDYYVLGFKSSMVQCLEDLCSRVRYFPLSWWCCSCWLVVHEAVWAAELWDGRVRVTHGVVSHLMQTLVPARSSCFFFWRGCSHCCWGLAFIYCRGDYSLLGNDFIGGLKTGRWSKQKWQTGRRNPYALCSEARVAFIHNVMEMTFEDLEDFERPWVDGVQALLIRISEVRVAARETTAWKWHCKRVQTEL